MPSLRECCSVAVMQYTSHLLMSSVRIVSMMQIRSLDLMQELNGL